MHKPPFRAIAAAGILSFGLGGIALAAQDFIFTAYSHR